MEWDPRPTTSSTRISSTNHTAHYAKTELDGEISAARADVRGGAVLSRIKRTLQAWFPRLYTKSSGALTYIRGPRPEIVLPNPISLFDRSYTFNGHTVSISIESTILRITRPFTSGIVFTIFIIIYFIASVFIVRSQWYLTPASSLVDCTSVFWTENAGCGLNVEFCTPFNNYSLSFRCPAQCSSVVLQNPRLVGNTETNFVPLLVGGGDTQQTYRADSFLCASAIQAGLIRDSMGGCATVNLVGNFTDYVSTIAFGLTSVGFPSGFPMSYRLTANNSLGQCIDLRNVALAINILVTCLLFVVFRPTSAVLYWSFLCIGFWHVALFSQPQGSPPSLDVAFGAFLPTLFVGYAFWRVACRFTMPAFRDAPLEAMIWYLPPFWTGVLTNLTTANIPINRLTATDITQQSGGVIALVIIVMIVLVCVLNQTRVIRKTGWLPKYLGWYVVGGLIVLAISFLPGLQFRLHHYVISMVLLPGTGFPTRLSAIYQGFLIGMFLNGVTTFGFDSILQTVADLARDGPTGSPLPTFLTNSTTYNASIALTNQTIFWGDIPSELIVEGWNGFSLLIDDVERYAGNALNYTLAGLDAELSHFFRLAYTSRDVASDFTMPATLWPNGTWVDPLPGPS
ncbi:hypothetical protein J3A83DRAFT_4373009 [Scleroderma citrinum]